MNVRQGVVKTAEYETAGEPFRHHPHGPVVLLSLSRVSRRPSCPGCRVRRPVEGEGQSDE
jgi:hypothetical protein